MFLHIRLEFPLFCAYEKNISHIPRSSTWEIATRRSHAGRTSIRAVILMLNDVTMSYVCRISAYSGTS